MQSSTTQPVFHQAAKPIRHECHWSFPDAWSSFPRLVQLQLLSLPTPGEKLCLAHRVLAVSPSG